VTPVTLHLHRRPHGPDKHTSSPLFAKDQALVVHQWLSGTCTDRTGAESSQAHIHRTRDQSTPTSVLHGIQPAGGIADLAPDCKDGIADPNCASRCCTGVKRASFVFWRQAAATSWAKFARRTSISNSNNKPDAGADVRAMAVNCDAVSCRRA